MRSLIPRPQKHAHKPDFSTVPPHIVQALEDKLSSKIIAAETLTASISAAACFAVTCENGQRYFIKGSSPLEMSHGAETLRSEIAAYKNVPVVQALAPALIASVHDADDSGWHLGVWRFVDHNRQHNTQTDNPPAAPGPAVFFNAVKTYAGVQAPSSVTSVTAHPFLRRFFSATGAWTQACHDPHRAARFQKAFAQDDHAGAWLARHAQKLSILQARVAEAPLETALLHGDLRCDNFLFSAARTYIVDWPNIAQGPQIFDLLTLCAHMHGCGYGPMQNLLDTAAAVTGIRTDANDVLPLAASMAGYFMDQVWRDVPVRMPQLRWMQKLMLSGLFNLLETQDVIESPPAFRV